VDKSNGRIGLGVVIRDHTGKLCAAKSLTRIGFLEPVAAEAMAVLVAVQWCGELGFHRCPMPRSLCPAENTRTNVYIKTLRLVPKKM
jgi:hypothetical protein